MTNTIGVDALVKEFAEKIVELQGQLADERAAHAATKAELVDAQAVMRVSQTLHDAIQQDVAKLTEERDAIATTLSELRYSNSVQAARAEAAEARVKALEAELAIYKPSAPITAGGTQP